MKNKSWQYPFETLDDKMFDRNKDGTLDSFETFFRDMHLNEMNQKADIYCKTESKRKQHTVYNDKNIPTINTNDNKNIENNTSDDVQLFVILLVIVVLIGGSILALSAEVTMFIRAVIIFAAVAISISLLKFAGLFK